MEQTLRRAGKAQGRRKPDGGFIFISAQALVAALWCHRERHITLRQLRVWLALHEMTARRCELEPGRKPVFGLDELRGLVGGGGGQHLRRDLKRLESLGLAKARQNGLELLKSVENLKLEELTGF